MTNEREDQASSMKPRLSADSINFDNAEERKALLRQVLEAGNAIALAERAEMIRMGIIDECGNLLMTELPDNMR